MFIILHCNTNNKVQIWTPLLTMRSTRYKNMELGLNFVFLVNTKNKNMFRVTLRNFEISEHQQNRSFCETSYEPYNFSFSYHNYTIYIFFTYIFFVNIYKTSILRCALKYMYIQYFTITYLEYIEHCVTALS